MHIERILLRDIGPFDDVMIELPKGTDPKLADVYLLTGPNGTGKSTLCMDLAARVSRGDFMPDGQPLERARDVIILSAEDGAADTIRPRLDAAGGDPTRVHLFVDVLERDEEGRERRRPPSLPADVERLQALVEHHHAAGGLARRCLAPLRFERQGLDRLPSGAIPEAGLNHLDHPGQ